MMHSKEPGTVATLSGHAGPANHADTRPGGAQLLIFPSRSMAPVHRRQGVIAAVGEAAESPGLGERLTPADHAALLAWIDDPGHGYDRLHIERDVRGGMAGASFALVYRPGISWSVWGVARQGDALEVWRCATGRTVGRFRTMPAALAALPHASRSRRA